MFQKDKKDYIISLYDFTKESEVALNHATLIAGQTGNEVQLLHVINKETRARLKKTDSDVESLINMLKEIAEKNELETKVPTSYKAIEGSIFTSISEYADELKAALMILGTHGVTGMQHVVGAHSLRVIFSSNVPVIVVQKRKSEYHGYKRIVLPIDYSKYGKNKIDHAVAMAKYFKAEIILIKSNTEEPALLDIVNANLSYALFLLKVDNILHEIHSENDEDGIFSTQIIDVARESNADLIVISSEHKSSSMKDLFFGINEIEIINNEGEIAVMCVNPLDDPDDVQGD